MTRSSITFLQHQRKAASSGFALLTVGLLVTALALLSAPQSQAATAGGTTVMGGATAPGKPVIHDAICSSGCVGLRRAAVGGTVQITGSSLDLVSLITFAGETKRVSAPVTSATSTRATVIVPEGAANGRLKARDDYGSVSDPSPKAVAIVARQSLRAVSGLEVTGAEATPRKAFFFGARMPRLNYVINSSSARNDLRIDVTGVDGSIVRSYFRSDVPRNTVQKLRWDGRDTAGRPAPGGKYSFRISAQSGEVARYSRKLRARSAGKSNLATDPLGFQIYPYAFPVRSRVSWGDGLGAGRGHQGVDLMADCGKAVVAARGGTVIYKGDMSGAAGNYVVISGRSTGLDFAYMHLLRPVRFQVGDTVRTGQVIGLVGSTGRSSACHLHFETWSAPGWYKGGSPVDGTRMLKRWYRQ